MLIECVAFVFELVDTHLQESFCRSKKFSVEAIADGVFEFFFDGIVAADIEHVVDEEEKA